MYKVPTSERLNNAGKLTETVLLIRKLAGPPAAGNSIAVAV